MSCLSTKWRKLAEVQSYFWGIHNVKLEGKEAGGLTDELADCRLLLVDVALLLVGGHVVFGLGVVGWAVDDGVADRLDPHVLVFRALDLQFVHFGVGGIGGDDVDASRVGGTGFLSDQKLLEGHDASLQRDWSLIRLQSNSDFNLTLFSGLKKEYL
jgi:hypothetical protein